MQIKELTLAELPTNLRQLHEIPQPPEKLWKIGAWPAEETKLLAVVGSRALTQYGRQACESLIEGLAGYPVSIVSGLALGADACAHKAALRAGLHTIAIPGSGLHKEWIYPRANVDLAQEILDTGGLLLSEHPPEYAAHPYDFPSRNRIMVGLADAVLMIEAGERSGTLITARFAGEYNRHLLCVPHRIGDPNSYGPHAFLRLGATVVTEPSHILEALRIEVRSEEERPLPELSESERTIYKLLSEPRNRDELLRSSGLPAHEALSALGMLELKGVIREEFGSWRRSS